MSADAFVSATLDIGDVEKGLDAMERRARALGPAFKELKTPFRADQRDHAKKRRGPFAAWARRAPSTLAAYRARGTGRVPRPLGKLLSAVKYTADATGIAGESIIAWSAAHMDGATVGRGVKIKARPSLWLSRKLLDTAENVIGRRLLSAYGSGK
jgi:hypothetical protein